ncbi:MAG: hypothetical protein NT040_08600 [Bacteroidetes bacterium]|nr:hypothetical protein [Bacteroidota bacterium]
MKKIQSALIFLVLAPCLLCISGGATAQENTKSVDCQNSTLSVTRGVDQDGCYYDVLVHLHYSTAGTDPRACPHGIRVSFEHAYIRTVSQPLPAVWFNSAAQSPKDIPENPLSLQEICWSRRCDYIYPNAIVPADYDHILQPCPIATYTVRIYVQPFFTTFYNTVVHLKIVQGYGWLQGMDPGCNIFDCLADFTFPNPPSPYSIICLNPPPCDLCTPPPPKSQVLEVIPTPPAGSAVEWYVSKYPCPAFPGTGWTLVSPVGQSLANSVTYASPVLTESKCYIAVITEGCNSYTSSTKPVFVCNPNGGLGIAANPSLDNQHACTGWSGSLSLTGLNVTCPTTYTWKRKGGTFGSGWNTVPSSSGKTTIQTGSLTFVTDPLDPDACSTVYSFSATITSINNACPAVTRQIDIYIDKPLMNPWGRITASQDLKGIPGIGTTIMPVFCDCGYTSLSYHEVCAKVQKWQKSISTDPCGLGLTWGPWTDIDGASTQDNTSYFTNMLHRTTKYRVEVKNFACPAVYSNEMTVKIIPTISVTISSNPPCPNLCYGPVLLTASVNCPGAYTSINYSWHLNGMPLLTATNSTYAPTVAGNYFVAVTGLPCGTTQSNTITVCGAPTVTLEGPCGLCPGQTVLLHPEVNGCCLSPPFDYMWNNLSTTENIVVGPGYYSVTVKVGNCYVTASITIEDCPSAHFVCGHPIVDCRDGVRNVYQTIQIGTQCWMQQNMNIGSPMINGSDEQTDNQIFEKYCYGNSLSNCNTYGGLYQWGEAVQYETVPLIVQGICPTGWHLPTDAEWCTLITFVTTSGANCNAIGTESTTAGGRLKETGTIHWGFPNTGATDYYGFTGLPGGYRANNVDFFDLHELSYFWSSSEYTSGYAWGRYLTRTSADDLRSNSDKHYGFSVRCVKD